MFASQEYLETQVMTASGPQLHLMVIDGAIRHAKRAEAALEANDFETAHFALNSSRDFVAELMSGLDDSHDPLLVERLNSLFLFVFKNLISADQKHDPQLVRDAVRVLDLHRETWVQLMDRLQDADPDRIPTPHGVSWTT